MDIETLKDKLDGETLAKLRAYIDDLTGQRDAARGESIEGRKKLKAEVESLRAIKDTLFDKLGLDDDADLDNLPEAKGQAEAVKQYEAKLKRMEREKADALAARDDALGKHKSAMQKAMLSEALGGHEFVARDVVETFVSGRLTWDGEDLFYKADDGKLLSVKDGIAGLAKTRPELLKSAGAGGAGVKSVGAGGAGGKTQFTRAELEAMTPQQRLDAANSGAQII